MNENRYKYVVKKILNNNVIISEDDDGQEVIITGKGIGCNNKVHSKIDSNDIFKIYDLRNKGFKHKFVTLLNEIPFDCFTISEKIIDYAEKELKKELNQNLIIALADHIHFALKQNKKGISTALNMNHEIKRLYKVEYAVAKHAWQMVNDYYGVTLSPNEVASIAFHLINAESNNNANQTTVIINTAQRVLDIIEQSLNITLCEESLAYSRLVIHLKYFIQRVLVEGEQSEEEFDGIFFNEGDEEYIMISKCITNIENYLKDELNVNTSNSERLFLLIHIMRILKTKSKDEK